MKDIDVLECTLRDGSYPIAYQFTAHDTALIASGLESAGFKYIEIGHGLGLGASGPKHGQAAASDEAYLEAAASVLTRALFGMFFIPGIGTSAHLRMAADRKMGFVRIGTNVNETEQGEPFIKEAKQLGMQVSANLMKTYAAPFDEVVRRCVKLAEWGADIVCVVDSAGGMLPDEVRRYVGELCRAVPAKIGFHGHNNLQLAVANSLVALEAGAHIVDTTLRGLGRSSGNAQTEVLVMILEKLGCNPGLDVYKTMDLGEKVISPMARGRGVDPIEVTTGYALFHSSFLQTVFRAAQDARIDPRELIIRVSEIDKIKVTDELARKIAAEISSARKSEKLGTSSALPSLLADASARPAALADQACAAAREVHALAAKTGRQAVFTIARAPAAARQSSFPFVRGNALAVIGNAEVVSAEDAKVVAAAVDGQVDTVMLDRSLDRPGEDWLAGARSAIRSSRAHIYSDLDALVRAADAELAHLLPGGAPGAVCIAGSGPLARKLAHQVAQRGTPVLLWGATEENRALASALNTLVGSGGSVGVHPGGPASGPIRVLVGAGLRTPVVDEAMVESLPPDAVLFDAGVGCLTSGAVARAKGRGLAVWRIDMRAGLSSEISIILETDALLKEVAGARTFNGVRIVAGGVVGDRGDVVVDALAKPAQVLGVADGQGSLLGEAAAREFADCERRVREGILAASLRPS